ncbi:BspA family leucine-rich repeat surface protein [Chryseobacterium polytrichastri]|uniref:Por secretion system C-terminal sorting domain-containing protein n=1 Tax=Chryseobacterium polytrichastri TaxID=1302687 RepID=A0A1M7D8X6_9FLAO|nr:BspA family leucine-rich repeat surface protein [Chryseobacterium polytrichastri]SHL75905.1 Por secretion system C-terminal sorting domain-containing protein [Chryseobacterium polytrichastri]
MYKKLLPFLFLVVSFHFVKAQNEFTTIWKVGPLGDPAVQAPSQAANNQIWFPGIGQNFTIAWEEVGYPQHNAILTNVTSTKQVLIDFGTALNPVPSEIKYRVKVSNGNGIFQQIRFGQSIVSPITQDTPLFYNLGSADKLLEVEHWGTIQWTSMFCAFVGCNSLKITATDIPNFSGTTDLSYMFYNAPNLIVSPSFYTWNTSTIKNFQAMFGYSYQQVINDTFDAPLYWDTSAGENFSYMFYGRQAFNQNISNWNMMSAINLKHMFNGTTAFNQSLNNWNVSNVTNMNHMFYYSAYNQPLNNWNTSSVTDMSSMFSVSKFNQPINSWNISNVTTIQSMFHDADFFNQSLASWNTANIINASYAFAGADSFNQNLASWNLNSLTNATHSIGASGIDCINYSNTIEGWANNPNTPNNVPFMALPFVKYSPDVIPQRNILISKGWLIMGDTLGTCQIIRENLSTSENSLSQISIYPNPAQDIVYVKNLSDAKNFIITDLSGRIITKDTFQNDHINISNLIKGSYILQIIAKDKIHTFKFIKK